MKSRDERKKARSAVVPSVWLGIALAGLLAAVARAAPPAGGPTGPEPAVTAVSKPGGVTEITIAPAEGGKPVVYRLDLSKHFSPAGEKTPALTAWESYRFGAFVCFGSNQFSGSEHCGTRDPKIYNPTALDVPGWIAAFKQAGMKYAVLTARHTSHFLLWDSATTTCDVASSGNKTDVVEAFVTACRREGIAPGLYYCMWGGKKFNPHPNARAIILAQLYELATRYGRIPYFWIDMMNWTPADLSVQDVYDAIKSVQPEAIVIMNQHVQDGTKLAYFPTDAMNGELTLPPAAGHNPWRKVEGASYYLPFEYEPCSQRREGGIPYDPLGPSCWFTYGEGKPFAPSRSFPAEAMYGRIRMAYERGAANVLLATAPDHTGRMREADVAELVRLGKMLAQLTPSTGSNQAAGKDGLVASYDFREGKGQTLRDTSGRGNHGQVRGAAWQPSGDKFVLRLDGVNDHVNCGTDKSLSLSKAITVEAWVYPDGVPGAGEPGVVGKSHGSYLLTYYTNGAFWWYISGGGNHCQAPAAAGVWHHVVGTFDGKHLKLYVDGVLADTVESKVPTISAGGPLFLGVNASNSSPEKWAHFKGMLTDVKIYDRALAAHEVSYHYRTTNLTGQITLRHQAMAFRNKLAVSMDLRGLGELPRGASASLVLFGSERAAPLATRRLALLPGVGTAEATLSLGAIAAGKHQLRAAVLTPDGKPIGKMATCEVVWPARPQWPGAPQARALNNLVTELINVADAPQQETARYDFVNPREGWVFLSASTRPGRDVPVSLTLDGKKLSLLRVGNNEEAMCFLPQGVHELKASGAGRIVVRAVPELIFASFGAHPLVREFGRYDWEFLSKHVLPNVNVLVGEGYENEEQRRMQPGVKRPDVAGTAAEPATKLHPVERWKNLGRRWIVECGVPGLSGTQPVTADEAFRYWSGHKGMTDRLLDGLIVDEFGGGEDLKYAAWTAAIRRIREAEQFRGKLFYPYCAPMYGAKASREFIQTAMDAGWRFAFERYLPEQRNEAQARSYLQSALSEPIAAWCRRMPGAERHMIVCMGTFSQAPESLDVDPAVNHKVFLDMQLNLLANDPACAGLYGVMTYLSSYTDEETVRWMGRLFRHYCIEGQAEPLASDPYRLPHLENGDFEDGLAGWTVAATEPGSVAPKTVSGFSWLEGRYPLTRQGDTVLWMKRKGERANVVSQKVKSLQPGRLYSLRLYSADGRDLSVKPEGLSITVDGVDMLPGKCFRHVFPNCYSHHHGPFDAKHRAWMNFHWLVFRAKADHATLRISDRPDAADARGPSTSEVILNFVQIQPYEE